jgi:hypothetical protein
MQLRGTPALVGTAALVGWIAWDRPWRPRWAPSRLLDEFVPDMEFRDTVSLRIAAPPAAVFRAFRDVTLNDMPVASVIGQLRYLPSRLNGTLPPPAEEIPFLELVYGRNGEGILAEIPDREMIVGSVGRLHSPVDQQLRLLNAAEFRTFAEPDHEKLAMSFRVEDVDSTGCTGVLEHRTQPTDEAARRKFWLYWLAIKPGGAFMTNQLLRAVRARAESAA